MAVIPGSLELFWTGSSGGSQNRHGPIEYTAIWRVQVDDFNDQSQVIVDWWKATQFDLGAPYIYANDADPTYATCESIRPERMMQTPDFWLVVVKFSEEDSASKKKTDGSHTINPLEYRPIIRCSTNVQGRPATELYYDGGYSTRVTNKIGGIGTKTIPVNSALKPFDPQPVLDHYLWFISVEANLATFDADLAYVGYINDGIVEFDYQGFRRGPCTSYQCKIRDCEVEFTREQSTDFWRVRYFIEVLPNGDDYLLKIPDVGMDFMACPGDGDQDGNGNAVGQTQDNRSVAIAGMDYNGHPIRGPIPLDGDGKPANVCAEPYSPVLGIWWENKTVDFHTLPIIQDIILPAGP